jgi:hypothetical protein
MEQDKYLSQASKILEEVEKATSLQDWGGKRDNLQGTLAILLR